MFLNSYKRNAATRGLTWELTDEQAFILFGGDCEYCGAIANEHMYRGSGCSTSFACNGIDRIDNELGYTLDNVVSCCKLCNVAKSNKLYTDWMRWIGRIVERNRERIAESHDCVRQVL